MTAAPVYLWICVPFQNCETADIPINAKRSRYASSSRLLYNFNEYLHDQHTVPFADTNTNARTLADTHLC